MLRTGRGRSYSQPRSIGDVHIARGDRQAERKSCATQGRTIVGTDMTTVRLDDRLGDLQTKAHAGLLGREEAIEQMRQVLGIDAWSAIFDYAANGLGVDLLHPDRDALLRKPRLGQGLRSIDHEIDDQR